MHKKWLWLRMTVFWWSSSKISYSTSDDVLISDYLYLHEHDDGFADSRLSDQLVFYFTSLGRFGQSRSIKKEPRAMLAYTTLSGLFWYLLCRPSVLCIYYMYQLSLYMHFLWLFMFEILRLRMYSKPNSE